VTNSDSNHNIERGKGAVSRYKKIAVFVSGNGSNLQNLLDSDIAENIAIVCSNKPDCFAMQRAKNAGIKTYVVDENILDILEQEDIYLIVLAGYLKIISDDLIAKYPERIINVHPSLIPDFCGMGWHGLKIHQAAIKSGKGITGATVHIVDGVVDGGKILAQKAIEIKDNDTPETLQKRVLEEAEFIILPEEIKKLIGE